MSQIMRVDDTMKIVVKNLVQSSKQKLRPSVPEWQEETEMSRTLQSSSGINPIHEYFSCAVTSMEPLFFLWSFKANAGCKWTADSVNGP